MELFWTAIVEETEHWYEVLDMGTEKKIREQLKNVLEPKEIDQYINDLKLTQKKDFSAQGRLNEMNKKIEGKLDAPKMEAFKRQALNFKTENSIRPAPYTSPRLEKK